MLQTVPRRRVFPLTADDIAGLSLYRDVFLAGGAASSVLGGLREVLHNYSQQVLSSRLGERVGVIGWEYGYSIYTKSYGGSPVADIYIDRKSGKVSLLTEFDPEEVMKILEALGSVALSIALALVDKLSSLEECEQTPKCSELVNNLRESVSRVLESGTLLTPDTEVYEQVMELLEVDLLPFASEVPIENSEYRKITELGRNALKVKSDERYKELSPPTNILFALDEDRKTYARVVMILPGTLRIRLDNGFLEYEVRINITDNVHSGKPHVLVTGSIAYVYEVPPERLSKVKEIPKNWYDLTIQAISGAIKHLETDRELPPEVVKPVADYLRAWLKLLTKYGNEIEENKKLHL